MFANKITFYNARVPTDLSITTGVIGNNRYTPGQNKTWTIDIVNTINPVSNVRPQMELDFTTSNFSWTAFVTGGTGVVSPSTGGNATLPLCTLDSNSSIRIQLITTITSNVPVVSLASTIATEGALPKQWYDINVGNNYSALDLLRQL